MGVAAAAVPLEAGGGVCSPLLSLGLLIGAIFYSICCNGRL